MLLYSDPYKDNPFGKLQGEVLQSWFVLYFSEAKLYKQDDSYVLAGIFTKLESVARSYKPEQAIEYPVKAIWTIHEKDYEVRKKNDEGKYVGVPQKASKHEKLLYQHITDNPSQWLDEAKNIKGKIVHLNDGSYEMQGMQQLPANSFEVEQIEPTGNLPAWSLPKKGNWNGGGGYNKGASLDEKVTWLKSELAGSITDVQIKKDFQASKNYSVGEVFSYITNQWKDDETTLAGYVDLLKGVLS